MLLSTKTIEMAIRALAHEQEKIAYYPLIRSADTDDYKYAKGAIELHDEYEQAIDELKAERIRAVERENATKA